MSSALPYWTALLYGLLAAGAVIVGGGLVGAGRRETHGSHGILPAMGAGFLIGLGCLSALPEALSRSESKTLALSVALTAFGLVLVAHRAGHRRFQEHGSHGSHESHASHESHGMSLHDARLAVAGLALHSLLDGVAVSASLSEHQELGVLVAIFVVLHKVPEGAAAAALIYASGGDARRARWGVLGIALATALGALTIFAVGPLLALALSVTAGVTTGVGVGIAGHLFKHRARRALLGVAAGAMLFALSELLPHA
jgi:zinc and cadmium transporter